MNRSRASTVLLMTATMLFTIPLGGAAQGDVGEQVIRRSAEAHELEPHDVRKHWQYAYDLFEWGRLHEAAREFERSEKTSGPHAYSAYMLGAIYELSQDYDDARAEYLRSVQLDPTYAPARESLAHLDALTGDLQRFRAATDLLRRDSRILGGMVVLLLLIGLWRVR